MACPLPERELDTGFEVAELLVQADGLEVSCGVAVVARRLEPSAFALAFHAQRPELIEALRVHLDEARARVANTVARKPHASDHYLAPEYRQPSRDLFTKCTGFRHFIEQLQSDGIYHRMFRVSTNGSLSNRVTAYDPLQARDRSMICFDSNSYLCLHDHPRVIARVESVLRSHGYGSPSAQLLGGTHHYLLELEQELSAVHGREDTIVFPTGFAANTGVISALVRGDDALLRDCYAHASIQEACRASSARFNRIFRHNDMASLERLLKKADASGCAGKLIVTDGVFSMHGRIAPLPQLVALARQYGAKLMIDDAHGFGVMGRTGVGVEEHFDLRGSTDILMGTLSKSVGALGGYVSGSRELVTFLRFFAPSAMFTTSTPAAWCAGMVEAIRVMRDEPQHHAALWRNIEHFVPALRAAGFIVPDPESPIVTIFLGSDRLTFEVNRELFDLGIKCSSVVYPAVAKNQAILRLVLTSKHTAEDLTQTIHSLETLGRKYGILHRSPEEICAIGARRFGA